MRFFKSDSGLIGVLLVLAITQLIGWGTIGLPAVVGRDLGADLGMSLPAVFAGSSVLYVTMGLCAPWLAKAFARHGARKVMMAGTVVSVPGKRPGEPGRAEPHGDIKNGGAREYHRQGHAEIGGKVTADDGRKAYCAPPNQLGDRKNQQDADEPAVSFQQSHSKRRLPGRR